MGVPGLIALLRQRAPGAFAPLTTAELRGKRVGVDLAISLNRGLAVHVSPLFHLECLARQALWLLGLGCRPVYVCDGQSPEEKAEERARRAQRRRDAQARLEEARERLRGAADSEQLAEAQERVAMLERATFECLPQHRTDSEELLAALGAVVLRAAGEAERTLAQLQLAGALDHLFTEDVDAIVCGARSYVKDAGALQWGGAAVLVSLDGALRELELDYDAFVTLALLSGCDFAPKLPGLGPATALKLVRRLGPDLETCLRSRGADDAVVQRYARARLLLRRDDAAPPAELPEPEPDEERLGRLLEDLQARGEDASGLRRLLLQHGLGGRAQKRPRVAERVGPEAAVEHGGGRAAEGQQLAARSGGEELGGGGGEAGRAALVPQEPSPDAGPVGLQLDRGPLPQEGLDVSGAPGLLGAEGVLQHGEAVGAERELEA